MKNKKGLITVVVSIFILTSAYSARTQSFTYNETLLDDNVLASPTSEYKLDMSAIDAGSLSAQAVYSSSTVSNVQFSGGTQSTGSFTVIDFTALSTAAASNFVTVGATESIKGDTLYLPGYAFREGIEWLAADSSSMSAVSLAAAMRVVPWLEISTNSGSAVIYATAPFGASWNSTYLTSSDNINLAVNSQQFSGGQDNSAIRINGVILKSNLNWYATTDEATTAISIAAAINTNAQLSGWITAEAAGSVVTATSTLSGAFWNFTLYSSTPPALAESGTKMTGGTDAAFNIGSSLFNVPGHGFGTYLALLYTEGSNPIGGLTDQATYFANAVDANTFSLSATSPGAGSGPFVTVTATSTSITEDTFTLSPLGITGTPSLKWEISNDDVNWSDFDVSSVTMDTYLNPPASTLWDLGYMTYRYIRLNVLGPDTGAIDLLVTMGGTSSAGLVPSEFIKNSSIHQDAEIDISTATIAELTVGNISVTGFLGIPDGSVTSAKLAANSVTTSKILDSVVSIVKLDFDTATQAELDIHEGNASAHHIKTIDASELSTGILLNDRVDGSSITKQGNSFNSFGELLKLSTEAGIVPYLPSVDVRYTSGRIISMTRNRTIKNTNWKVLYSTIYPGSNDIGVPTELYAAIYRDQGVGNCDLRLYDASNANVIISTSTVFPLSLTNFITLSPLLNINATPALWEIQGQATDGNTECELNGITIEW